MNIQEQEERDFIVATDQDWDNAEASELGAASPESAWILTDRDVWHANPYYQGPPVPHPEDDYAWEALEEENDPSAGILVESDARYEELLHELADPDDDIPF